MGPPQKINASISPPPPPLLPLPAPHDETHHRRRRRHPRRGQLDVRVLPAWGVEWGSGGLGLLLLTLLQHRSNILLTHFPFPLPPSFFFFSRLPLCLQSTSVVVWGGRPQHLRRRRRHYKYHATCSSHSSQTGSEKEEGIGRKRGGETFHEMTFLVLHFSDIVHCSICTVEL